MALLLLATVSVGVTAVRQVNRRGRVIGSAGITPGAMLPATGSNSLADPQALLRDLSRSRKSHVVVFPWMGEPDLLAGPSEPPSNDTLVPFEGFLHHFRD
ncbi:MAG: hypothetical protein ACK58T_15520, partial [Phycisphaerae bacterium]